MGTLVEAARTVVSTCMKAGRGEEVLVVTDEPCRAVGVALWKEACESGCEAMLVEMTPRLTNGQEPPRPVAEAMRYAAVCLLVTSKSLSHTRARKAACEGGSRIASLPGITVEMAERALIADYDAIKEFTLKASRKIEGSRRVTLTSAAGTHLTLSIEGRPVMPDTGIYDAPGAFGNLPAGEVFVAPVEGTANGVLVVDGSMAGIGLVDAPVRVEIEDGVAKSFTGGESAKRLESMILAAGHDARNVAELGIGTNGNARLSGNILEDEKVLGTVHVALGANAGFGGKVQVASHLDGIVLSPTLTIDGSTIMRDGHLLI
ncbi:MAG: aminopeptidase [Ignavibacteriales bacterium]